MFGLILFVIIAAVVWFAAYNWGTSRRHERAVKDREHEIRMGIYDARVNEEALRRIREGR